MPVLGYIAFGVASLVGSAIFAWSLADGSSSREDMETELFQKYLDSKYKGVDNRWEC